MSVVPVHRDPEILGGTPVFIGTRVPYQTLLDYLEADDPIEAFLEDFPTVSREQALLVVRIRDETLHRGGHCDAVPRRTTS